MPLNPDAVGAAERARSRSAGRARTPCSTPSGIGAGARRAGVHHREHQRRRRSTCSRRSRSSSAGAQAFGDGRASARSTRRCSCTASSRSRCTGRSPSRARPRSRARSRACTTRARRRSCVTTTSAMLDGEPLYTNTLVGVHPRRGRLGRRPRPVRPAERAARAGADHEVTYETSPDQAFVYRLSGDRNPLHTDPSFAAMGGFDRPILHGLCSYGFTGRALLHSLLRQRPGRFHHIEGRFASPVMPGEALTVEAWETGDGEAVFTTSVGDRLVIDQGLAALRPRAQTTTSPMISSGCRVRVVGDVAPSPRRRARPSPRRRPPCCRPSSTPWRGTAHRGRIDAPSLARLAERPANIGMCLVV